MRFIAVCLCLGLLLPTVSRAAVVPMTPKDLALMVRTGAPREEIMAELTKRRLAAPLTPAGEAMMRESGATAEFIASVKAGHYELSEAQAAALATRQGAEQAAASARAAAAEPAVKAANAPAGGQAMLRQLDGKLVKLAGTALDKFDAGGLGTVKYFVIYQSAHWCPPCRAFTPKLVEFYRKMKPLHPEFEVVFASCDHSEEKMKSYMTSEKMAWPTLQYSSRGALNKYCGSGIPWLVVVDAEGRPLSKNGKDKQYIGPEQILAEFEKEYLR